MKILLLTPQLPYPAHQGTSLRNFNIIRGLAERHQISLLSFNEGEDAVDLQQIKPLADLCEQIVSVPQPRRRSTSKRLYQMATTKKPDLAFRLRSLRFEITLRRILSEYSFDIVQVEGIELAWAIAAIRAVGLDQKLVFDAHNAEAQLQKRAWQADLQTPRRWPAAAYSWMQGKRLQKYERWACTEADWVTAVSQNDMDILLAQVDANSASFSVIPNSIDVTAYKEYSAQPTIVKEQGKMSYDLVFSGKMDYRPNVDAVVWFAQEVWPTIIAQRPASTWAIVGQKPHARVLRLRNLPGVTVTGWVDDVLPYLYGGKIFVMPFRVGSGTRLKFIEALAMGMPVVSTSLGVEGYLVNNEEELLLAESADEMREAILRLLAQPELRVKLGKKGQVFAQIYDWRQITPKFDEVYDALVV